MASFTPSSDVKASNALFLFSDSQLNYQSPGAGGCSCKKLQHANTAACVRDLERRFTAYGTEELRQVEVFKYLNPWVKFYDNNVQAMRHNLKKVQGVRIRIFRVL